MKIRKKYLLFCILSFLILLPCTSKSQDTLVLRTGTKLIVKVSEINPTEIKFKLYAHLDGATFIEKKTNVQEIIYSNGVREKIAIDTTVSASHIEPEKETEQQMERQTDNFSLGIGMGLGHLIVVYNGNWLSLGVGGTDAKLTFTTPVFTGSYERRVGEKFSLGLAASYQSFEISRFTSFYGPNTGIASPVTSVDKYSRETIAVRALLNLHESKHNNLYIGLRLGYTFWQLSSTNNSPSYIKENSMHDSPHAQFCIGYRHYIKKFGFGAEIGVGTAPYLINLSACYRLTKKDN